MRADGTWATPPGTGGATGFGVDGGTSAAAVTTSGTVANGTRLEKIGTLAGAITRTLPAISAVSTDTAICFDDAGQNIGATNTLTITANAVDGINGGAVGGSIGPFTTPALSVCVRVTATHNWTAEVSTTQAASTAPANQFANGLTANGLSYAQPAFSNLSGSASVAQIGGSAASHAVPVDVAGTSTYKVVPDCQDSLGNHLNYTQSTDAFSCGTSSSGGGGAASVVYGSTQGVIVPGATDAFLPVTGAGSTSLVASTQADAPSPRAGTIGNLFLWSQNAPTGSQTVAIKLWKNDLVTTLTCSMTSTATTCNDTTHTVSVVAGDLLAIEIITSATAASTRVGWGFTEQ